MMTMMMRILPLLILVLGVATASHHSGSSGRSSTPVRATGGARLSSSGVARHRDDHDTIAQSGSSGRRLSPRSTERAGRDRDGAHSAPITPTSLPADRQFGHRRAHSVDESNLSIKKQNLPPIPKKRSKTDVSPGLAVCRTQFIDAGIPVCGKDKCYAKNEYRVCRRISTSEHATIEKNCSDEVLWQFASHTFDPLFYENSAFVVMPRTIQDVVTVMKCAYVNKCHVAVKSGGHSYAGGSSIDEDGFVVFLHLIDKIKPGKEYLDIQAGARWREIYEAAWKNGHRVVTGGTCPSVSTGYILGGGVGPMTRMHGMGSDNVINFQIVMYNGDLLDVSKDKNPDLFWALRGGGQGNFGVVVSYRLRSFPAPVDNNNNNSGGEKRLKPYVTGQYEWKQLTKHEFRAALLSLHECEATAPPELTLTISMGPEYNRGKPLGTFFFHIDFDFIGTAVDATTALAPWVASQGGGKVSRSGLPAFTKECIYSGRCIPFAPNVRVSSVGEIKATYDELLLKDKQREYATGAWKRQIDTYPAFAIEHSTHMRYFETQNRNLIYKNVLLERYTESLVDSLIERMEKNDGEDLLTIENAITRFTKPGEKKMYGGIAYTHIHFPGSRPQSPPIKASDTAFVWRRAIFMLVRVVHGFPKDTNIAWKLANGQNAWANSLRGLSSGIGSYVSFPESFPERNIGDSIGFRYWGDNFDRLKRLARELQPKGEFNPLCRRSTLELYKLHREVTFTPWGSIDGLDLHGMPQHSHKPKSPIDYLDPARADPKKVIKKQHPIRKKM